MLMRAHACGNIVIGGRVGAMSHLHYHMTVGSKIRSPVGHALLYIALILHIRIDCMRHEVRNCICTVLSRLSRK